MPTIEISKVNSHMEIHVRVGETLSLIGTVDGTNAQALAKAKAIAEKVNADNLGGVATIVVNK